MELEACQHPTFYRVEPYTTTDGPFAAEFSAAYGMEPHEWQRLILNDWFGRDDDGKLVHSSCILAVSRQNGKTGVCDPFESWHIVKNGAWVLHTAQEFRTAETSFRRLRKKFGEHKNDRFAEYPELNALVKRYTISAGQMRLELVNGGMIEFRTRGNSDDFARGGTYDVVIVDEAQDYTDAQEAALGPLNSAAPHGSPQTVYMGTVPNPEKPTAGAVFRRLRNVAHSDKRPHGTCIHEWGVSEIGDVSDRSRWYVVNPSLGKQLLVQGLEKDLGTMAPDVFAREHLGWWPPTISQQAHPIGAKAWEQCATLCPPTTGAIGFGVKFSADGQMCAVAACRKSAVGVPHVEIAAVYDTASGIERIAKALAAKADETAKLAIDGKAWSSALVDALNRERYPRVALAPVSPADMSQACQMIASMVAEGNMTHYDQAQLTRSATGCVRRKIGQSGAWGFATTDEGEEIYIEAAALALWATMTARRDPTKRMRVG